MRVSTAITLCLLLTACSLCPDEFRAYDYDKHEDARIKLRDPKNEIKLKEDRLRLERTIPIPVGAE